MMAIGLLSKFLTVTYDNNELNKNQMQQTNTIIKKRTSREVEVSLQDQNSFIKING
jgi:hypothetical protein